MSRYDFTYLKVIERITSKDRHVRVLCECILCGATVEVRKSHVTTKAIQSCGCHAKLMPKLPDVTTGTTVNGILFIGYVSKSDWLVKYKCGHKGKTTADRARASKTGLCGACSRAEPTLIKHGLTGTATYSSWCNMRRRCYSSTNNRYDHYGGRGIDVCDEWNPAKGGTFENFLTDMSECPLGFSLERKDLTLGYNKDNCIWADDITQANNKTNNILIENDQGIVWSLHRWCEILGKDYKQSWSKLRNKCLSIDSILGTGFKIVQMN